MLPNLVILDVTEPRKPSSSAGIRQLTADQIQMLRAFIQKRVKNADDVDDILQCVFLEALRNEHKFQHASKPQTWLCGIALNLIRNHFRKMYRQPYQ
ncbi:RNA polymerase subunit sigma, partial [Pseudomonas syringae]